jgi:cation transporter-like permease
MKTNNSSPSVVHRHWHYVYKKRRQALGISTPQMATSQIFSLIGSIIAGVLLDANKETLVLIAGVFIILPGVFDLDGSIGAALSAKINHRLQLESNKKLKVFFETILFAFGLCVLSGMIVGLFGGAISSVFFDANFWEVFFIAWGAIILSGIIGFPLIALASIAFRSRGVNPDDVVGPIESSLFDILTVITVTIMTRMFL